MAELAEHGERVIVGAGDDAAVVRSRPFAVTSVDTVVDGVHFRLAAGWPSAYDIGWRALAAALSDIAAMGADAGEAYVSLGLPSGFGEQQALELMRGAHDLARRMGATIAGGDIVRSPALFVSAAAVGWTDDADRLVTRAGARVGERVAVTGCLGAAAGALAMLETADSGVLSPQAPSPGSRLAELLMERHRRPAPRLLEGRALAAAGASAMIDLSDGIASDAEQIGLASGVRLRIELSALPLAPGLESVARSAGLDALDMAASGGEDYELCICAPPDRCAPLERALADCPERSLTWVGEVVAGPPGASLVDRDGADRPLRGFEHRW
ncbi:MAG: thiamine-phosphate kinase [Acidobacteriota bacterium]|nr:thiamine-phosphate kinase [Acidobacteriota bacterium]